MFRRSVHRATVTTAAVGALVAGVALTACGPVKMGAAATIGDERITTAQLDGAVAQWRKEFDQNRQAALVQQVAEQRGQRIPFDQDSPHRSALFQLIGFRVWDEVGKEQGVTVTQGQIDGLLGGVGGPAGIAPSVLAADIPLRYTTDVARIVLIQQEMVRRSAPRGGLDPTAQQRAVAQTEAAYRTAAERLKITVNPRFGGFNPEQVALNPVTYRLSRTESGTG